MALPSLARPRDSLAVAPPPPLMRLAELLTEYGPALIILTLPLEFTAKYMGQPLVRWVMVLVAAALGYLLFTGRRRLALPRQASAMWLAGVLVVSAINLLSPPPPSPR